MTSSFFGHKEKIKINRRTGGVSIKYPENDIYLMQIQYLFPAQLPCLISYSPETTPFSRIPEDHQTSFSIVGFNDRHVGFREYQQQITGDKGARVLLKQLSAEELVIIPCEEAAFDVDRNEHLDRL